MKIAQVLPRRTSATPDNKLAFIGDLLLFLPDVDEVHVSCRDDSDAGNDMTESAPAALDRGAGGDGLMVALLHQLELAPLSLAEPALVALRAETTKSKRADSLPIHPQLADALREWKPSNAGPTDFVISTVPHMNCLRADLALAGIPDKDEAGRYVDFHSLRVSLSTMLAANRVSPRAAQAIMRHSDPRLTASVYTDEKLLPLAAELLNVPAIPAGRRDRGPAQSQSNLDAIVANLSASERQAIVGMLSRSQVG